jgi:hypothetical protein
VSELIDSYNEFIDLNQDLAFSVLNPAEDAADYDGAEAAFARGGNGEQLRHAIEMRNEWAEIQMELNRIIPLMETVVEGVSHDLFERLFNKQIDTMRDLSEAYQRGLMYKDKLINTRFQTPPIDPGELTELEVPEGEILQEPTADVAELKKSQDVAMGIVANKTGKIGDHAQERRKYISDAVDKSS